MTALNKQALRQTAEKAQEHGVFNMDINSELVLNLLDENYRLTAERDALRENIGGDNTRAAADIYFQLVEECEIPPGGSLVGYVDDIKERLSNAEKRIAELQSSVIAPGIMRCAGCGFVLTKNNINMAAGTITAGDSNTEPCPNGCGPLWPVTWKEQALQMRDDSEQWFEELQQSRQRIAELEARTVTVQLPADNAAESESPEDDATAWFDEGWNARGKADKEALIAAGIGVEGE